MNHVIIEYVKGPNKLPRGDINRVILKENILANIKFSVTPQG